MKAEVLFLSAKYSAHADDVSFGAFFVWKPAPNLAVGMAAGEPVEYRPYSNGQWVYTSNGWYFRAASEPEEITHHYGRWVYSPDMGWLWVPGRDWAPAWVDWREEDEYIAWTPIPPSVYIVNNVIIAPPVYEERFIVVERRYFIEPEVYRYTYKSHKHKVKITEWRRMDGIMVVNKTIINKGPDYTVIQSVSGRTFEPVVINHVTGKNKIKYSDREYDVYSPEFKKVKKESKVKGPVSKPKEFSNYHSASKKEKDNVNSSMNNSPGNDIKYNNTNNKGSDKKYENPGKERKYIDDKNMKNGDKNSKNRNDDNGKQNKREDKNSGKDNIKDKGNNSKGKDQKGNDDNKRQNDKGNKKFKNGTYKSDDNNNKNSRQDNKGGERKEKRNKKK